MMIPSGQWEGAFFDAHGPCLVELEVTDDRRCVLRRENAPDLQGESVADEETVLTDSPRTTLSYDCGRVLVYIDDIGTVVLKRVQSRPRIPSQAYSRTSEEVRRALQLGKESTQDTNHFFEEVWHLFSGLLIQVAERPDWPFGELSMYDLCQAIYTFHSKGEERGWCGGIQRSDDCWDVVDTVFIRAYEAQATAVSLDMLLGEMLDRRFPQNIRLLCALDIDEARLISYVNRRG